MDNTFKILEIPNQQAGNPQNSMDENRKKNIINHLYSLLHARSCRTKQEGGTCPINNCAAFQKIYLHLQTCKLGRNCREYMCCTSNQVMTHWKNCRDVNCYICQPIRIKNPKLNNLALKNNGVTLDMVKTYEILEISNQQAPDSSPQNTVTRTLGNQSTEAINRISISTPTSNKAWQSTVAENLRHHLVHQLVKAVYPTDNIKSMEDEQFRLIVQNAKEVENCLFNEANSRDQYYKALAVKIYKIQNDLKEKKNRALQCLAKKMNDGSNGSVDSSAQQQLQNILTKKKDELCPSEHVSLPDEVDRTSTMASSMAQEVKVEIKLENGIKMEAVDENAHNASTTNVANKIPAEKKVWGCNELRRYLLPVLMELYKLDQDAWPFRTPVDPIQLNIPDYFTVIKKPMDLSTIKRKMETGVYTDPWEFVDDVWLMFENAWLYNRKSSKVHRSCTKLAEVFEPEIDVAMRRMGFCCGKKYVFYPQVLCCYGKPMCTISVNAAYYSYQNRYVYCESCFLEIKGDEVELPDEPSQPSMIIQKELFIKTKNSEMEPELFVNCTHCGRKQHQICSMYHDAIWPGCFICNHCVTTVKRKENKFTAKALMQTKLGTYLENRVNSFLTDNKSGANPVTVRVHSIMEKSVEIKPGMKNRFCNPDNCKGGLMSEEMPYTAKAIFAYQEVDGTDVCFFGMHVQEYGSNCPAPNTRRVYIAYLDSVNFFQPKVFRTSVYHEILIGYLDYVKNLGFVGAHIWACPPSEGDDYIFHCHPQDMKIPKPKRLADWYKKMLDKAVLERIVIDYKDIMKDALENKMQNVMELPYFEGDFWPNVIETCIAELENEEQQKVENPGDVDDSDSVHSSHYDYEDNGALEPFGQGLRRNSKGAPSSKKKTASKKSGFNKKSSSKSGQAYPGNDLMSKLFVMMEKHREVFFVVRLRTHHESFSNFPPIKDPDPIISTDMMDGRDNFLMICREKHYEFSSLRRAKHSSMVMLYELHTQSRDSFIYCNNCKANMETHYHCSTCDDFDLCVKCYQSKGHFHPMEKIGLELEDLDDGATKTTAAVANGSKPGSVAGIQSASCEAKKEAFKRFIQTVVHASHCISDVTNMGSCKMQNCQKIKMLIIHSQSCSPTSGCPSCRRLLAASMGHVRVCHDLKCPVPFCRQLKLKLERQRTMGAQLERRRVAGMDPTSYVQAVNQRSVVPLRQDRIPTGQSNNIQGYPMNSRQVVQNVVTTAQQVKAPPGNSVMQSEGSPDTLVTGVTHEILNKFLNTKTQQSIVIGNMVFTDPSQLIAYLKSHPQILASLKKERINPNSPCVANDDGRLEIPSSSSGMVPTAPAAASQPKNQQQIILTCTPNAGQRIVPGNSATGLMHLSNSNRHLMLCQNHSNPIPSGMQDSSIPLQDQLSRYADQL